MQYVQLGKTDLVVSRICFGCWQLSPRFWGQIPLDPWCHAINKAVDLGINFIDTAGAYGDGYAESCLGDYLSSAKLRDKFYIATKFYWTFQKAERHPDTSYDFIIRECEGALKRLRTDYIDLWQVHAWDPLTRPEEVAAALYRLRKEGKIRWAGVSNLNVEQISLYREFFEVASLQPWYNLLEREIEARELPYCLQHRIGVIPYSPLYRGLLTGKYSREHVFDDDRATLPLYQGKAFHCMLDALDQLSEIAENLGLTVAQLCVRWLLTQPAVSSAIVGIKTAEQIETIAPAADDILSIELWHKMARIMDTAKMEALRMK